MFDSKLYISSLSEISVSSTPLKEVSAKIQLFRTSHNNFDFSDSKYTTLIILALPNYFTYSDLNKFIENHVPIVIRYFKNVNLNCSMVVLQFNSSQEASDFYVGYNGKKFIEHEPEVCHVFYIESIVYDVGSKVSVVDRKIVQCLNLRETESVSGCFDELTISEKESNNLEKKEQVSIKNDNLHESLISEKKFCTLEKKEQMSIKNDDHDESLIIEKESNTMEKKEEISTQIKNDEPLIKKKESNTIEKKEQMSIKKDDHDESLIIEKESNTMEKKEEISTQIKNDEPLIKKKESNTIEKKDEIPFSIKKITEYELPSCPVCLERIDTELSGVLSIQCNHTFHCNCLFAWKDLTCPVCRSLYSSMHQTCSECDCHENLYTCLICGKIGCNRYEEGHAKSHALEENHFFALEIGTGSVWDYVNDVYVHRLVHESMDNKIVQVDYNENKPAEIRKECEILLIVQLEKQKMFYEALIRKVRSKYRKKRKRSKVILKMYNEEYAGLKEKEMMLEKVSEKIHIINKEREIIKGRNNGLIKTQMELVNKLKIEEDKRKILKNKIEMQENELRDLKKQIKEMEEERKELYFHIEAQSNLTNESKNGSLIIKKKKRR